MKIIILFPIIWSTWGKLNDCLYVIVKTIVCNRGLYGNNRIKQVIRGMSLEQKNTGWNRLNTLQLAENWYLTSRSYFIDMIAQLVGYYLRTRAGQLCKRLNYKWEPMACLDCLDGISRFAGFVQLSDELFELIKGEVSVNCSENTTMHRIKSEFVELSWKCLNSGDSAVFLSSTLTNISQPTLVTGS